MSYRPEELIRFLPKIVNGVCQRCERINKRCGVCIPILKAQAEIEKRKREERIRGKCHEDT